ncbi:dTDP-glucose 4,6-dehydratase [Candidatus Woesearchaeota archaeon]|nr:dTDP-glucose 4,6-dehydratase [Candidatus Woesearchaeota archaeon]
MTVLVTGGAGFIGSNFVRYYLQKHPHVHLVNFDALTYCGNLDNLKDIASHPHYRFVHGDVCDRELVEKCMQHVDLVFHFAAESHVDNSIKDPYVFTRTNVLGTHVLLEAAKKMHVKRFVHISTDEVYGSILNGSFKETDPLEPNSPYAASKASAELLVRGFFVTFGLPVVVTRSSNNFGPYQYPEKMIPLFVTNLLEGKKVPLYGDGMNVRDWLYVLDNCEAIDFVATQGKTGEIYNIGGGNECSNYELTKLLLQFTHREESFIQKVPDRLGHDRRYSLDCQKIRQLGWQPQFHFTDALQETVAWYQQHEAWWKKLKKI